MTDTQIHHSPSDILWRVAWPFFLFTTILASLLALSFTLLLPRYTHIDVGGQLRTADEILQYQNQLTTQIGAKEDERRQFVLAVHDPAYDALKEHRRSRVPLDDLRAALEAHAKKVMEKDNIVQYESFDYDPDAKTLVITGDIRNVGTSSMTRLAEFAPTLSDLPFVASASTPTYAREEDRKIGFYSPFSITLRLK